MAARRLAFEETLDAVIEKSDLEQDIDALVDEEVARSSGRPRSDSPSVSEAMRMMPYDYSPAR